MGYKKHFRVHHGENEFARGNCHINGINGIESFWSYAKRRLANYTSRNVNLDFITERKISLIEYLLYRKKTHSKVI